MKTTVTEHDFREAFRTLRPDNFSYAGLGALFNFLEETEEGSGQEMEFDCIGICCDFSEYANLKDFQDEYGAEEYPDRDAIQENMLFIEIDDDAFIISE